MFHMKHSLAVLLWLLSATIAHAADPVPEIVLSDVGFCDPRGIAWCADGRLYIADQCAARVKRWTPGAPFPETYAGTGIYGFAGDGGPAAQAQFRLPLDVTCRGQAVYISDSQNHRIRRVVDGTITTIYTGPGQTAPRGLAVDGAGAVTFAAFEGNFISRVLTNGVVERLAGTGAWGFGADGPATASALKNPLGLYVEPSGRIIFAEANSQRLRAVSAGVITTLVGDGWSGDVGDGGLASGARLNTPYFVVPHPRGGTIWYDAMISRLRWLTADGRVERIATMPYIGGLTVDGPWLYASTVAQVGGLGGGGKIIRYLLGDAPGATATPTAIVVESTPTKTHTRTPTLTATQSRTHTPTSTPTSTPSVQVQTPTRSPTATASAGTSVVVVCTIDTATRVLTCPLP
jgi:hypothetical protein